MTKLVVCITVHTEKDRICKALHNGSSWACLLWFVPSRLSVSWSLHLHNCPCEGCGGRRGRRWNRGSKCRKFSLISLKSSQPKWVFNCSVRSEEGIQWTNTKLSLCGFHETLCSTWRKKKHNTIKRFLSIAVFLCVGMPQGVRIQADQNKQTKLLMESANRDKIGSRTSCEDRKQTFDPHPIRRLLLLKSTRSAWRLWIVAPRRVSTSPPCFKKPGM